MWYDDAHATSARCRTQRRSLSDTQRTDIVAHGADKDSTARFLFYNNYRSRKGLDLAGNAHASISLLGAWSAGAIEGSVAKVARESDDYVGPSAGANGGLG